MLKKDLPALPQKIAEFTLISVYYTKETSSEIIFDTESEVILRELGRFGKLTQNEENNRWGLKPNTLYNFKEILEWIIAVADRNLWFEGEVRIVTEITETEIQTVSVRSLWEMSDDDLIEMYESTNRQQNPLQSALHTIFRIRIL